MAELTFLQGGRVRALLDEAGVIDALAARIPSELRQAFKSAAKGGKLAAFLDEQRANLRSKLPEDARFLVTKLKDFDQQSFDLAGLTKDKTSGKAKLGARAGATVLLDALEFEQLQGEVGFTVDDDDTLLKLEVAGHLSGSAELEGTAGVLSAGVNFAGGTQQALAYYFTAERSAYVAEVLPRVRTLVFDSSSLERVVEAMDEHGLVRVERRSDSTTTLGLTIGVSREIGDMVGGLPVTGGVQGSLTVEFQDEAAFSLIVDRGAKDRYVIDFRKTRRKERSRVLKLGVDVRIAGLRNKLIDQIALAIPEDTKLTELLKELDSLTAELSQGVLKEKLAEALEEKWPEGKAAIAVLVGEETVGELAEQIQGELVQKIEDVINAKVDLLNTTAAAAARTVASEIGDALRLDGAHRQALELYVGEAVETAVGALGPSIDAAVRDLIGDGSKRLADLLTPWEKIAGDAVTDAVKALSKSTQNAVARVRKGLAKVHERYTRFRQGVLTAVKEKMEEELTISFVAEKKRTETHACAIRYEFRRADGAAMALYKALWTGDLSNFGSLLQALDSANKISLTGEYVLTESNVGKRALAVNFFGLELSSRVLFSSTVEIGIDLNGRLIAATSKAELEKVRRRFGESLAVEATWQVDYLRREVLDAPLFIQVALTDKNFESGNEVEDFFGPLEQIGAMRSGVSADVETTLFTSTSKSIKHAMLTVNVMLRWSEWLQLMGTDLDGRPVTGAWAADAVCREFLVNVETVAPTYTRAARELLRRRPDFTDLAKFLVVLGAKRRSEALSFLRLGKNRGADFHPGWRLAKAVSDLSAGIVALQANWKALVGKLPDDGARADVDLDLLRADVDAVNTAFLNAFGAQLSPGLALDGVGELRWLTVSTLNLFRARSTLTNPFLSCTFESPQTGRLLFS